MIRTPRDYQMALREFALAKRRCNWFAGTGTGKTGSALDVFDTLNALGEVDRMLVISKTRVARLVWSREMAKWENYRHLTCAVALGTPDQRRAAIARKAHVTTINYENLPWLIEQLNGEWPWQMVVADESTRLKSMRVSLQTSTRGKQFLRKDGAVRARALADVAHKQVVYWLNMTGTPAPNGLRDLWGQNWFVDAGQRLGLSFSSFADRWFRWRIKGNEAFQRELEILPYAEQQIHDAIRDVSITIQAKDYFDLPPLIVNVVKCPLPDAAYKHYREMEREMFTEIKGQEVNAVSAGAKTMKCRQLASGAVIHGETGEWVQLHEAKIEALRDIVEEANGEPVIVAYYFHSERQRLLREFPDAVRFDGTEATLQRFINGDIQMLLMHPLSDAHGLDGMQQECRIMIFFCPIWELEEYEQLIERIGPTRQVQSGFMRDVFVHVLVGENTIDEEMVERLASKASVQDALLQATKKRG